MHKWLTEKMYKFYWKLTAGSRESVVVYLGFLVSLSVSKSVMKLQSKSSENYLATTGLKLTMTLTQISPFGSVCLLLSRCYVAYVLVASKNSLFHIKRHNKPTLNRVFEFRSFFFFFFFPPKETVWICFTSLQLVLGTMRRLLNGVPYFTIVQIIILFP